MKKKIREYILDITSCIVQCSILESKWVIYAQLFQIILALYVTHAHKQKFGVFKKLKG